MAQKTLCIEIGTEELPANGLRSLSEHFKQLFSESLATSGIDFVSIQNYVTPRRLALIVHGIADKQADRQHQHRGPSLAVAFDQDGQPSKQAQGFARRFGASVDALEKIETHKGKHLAFTEKIVGKSTHVLIPEIIAKVLAKLPAKRFMRWDKNNQGLFIRPIRWVLALLEDQVINCEIMGVQSGAFSYGHRFHHPEPIVLGHAADYPQKLEKDGAITADFETRKQAIIRQINAIAGSIPGIPISSEKELEEVTGLVEQPYGFMGGFDEAYLSLPQEVLISTLQKHQHLFPIANDQNQLLPYFIGVANIKSNHPEGMQQGNECVVQARLDDARFFWDYDLDHGLKKHDQGLSEVIYHEKLGSLAQKQQRLIHHACYLAEQIGIEQDVAKRAAQLCLNDLLSKVVCELPELQGIMGYYYALQEGEQNEVAMAIRDVYQPRFADDKLPETKYAQVLAISEKIDGLLGFFSIGLIPSGTKDPFALRRAAIGLLRIIIECQLDQIDLKMLLTNAARAFPEHLNVCEHIDKIYHFLLERLRYYYMDKKIGVDTFESIASIGITRPVDFNQRLYAVDQFRRSGASADLITVNKRIHNILRRSELHFDQAHINQNMLTEKAEINLAHRLSEIQPQVDVLVNRLDYYLALEKLSELRDDIDVFFDSVMVLSEDEKIKANRLTLLSKLRMEFMKIADISKLQA